MRARDKEREPKVRKKPGRTPTSCAECRRLKLRCDKNVPCEKCVSRGCAEICPAGVLRSTKGNRMVLSGTEELHEHISQLQGRVRELETALHSMRVPGLDALLASDTLQLASPSQSGLSPASSSSPSKSSTRLHLIPTNNAPANIELKMEEENNTVDAFGTLTIGPNGATIYMGKTARSEFLLRASLEQELDPHPRTRFDERSSSPFPDLDFKETSYLREQVYEMLPPLSEAVHLCQVYLHYGRCMYTAITETELLDELMNIIYRSQSFQSHHALALLFSVFAIASHFDPHKEPYSIAAREYYQLAKTTLAFALPVQQTTLAAIQTLIHMVQYLEFTDSDSPSIWIYIGHAVRFAFSIGLHLNGARWMLPQDDIDRRSRVFWQLFTLDTWTSFYLGRPPSIVQAFIDCEYPKEPEDEGQEMCFHSWSYRFTTLLNSAMASEMGPKQPPYAAILNLDRQIRDFHVPTIWKATTESEASHPAPTIHFHRWLVLARKETVLLNLHRDYFAQALHASPHDIRRHRYLSSVVAIYRASWRVIRGLQAAWANDPYILARIHLPWSQALSAAVVVCLLVTRFPSSHLIPYALEALEALYSLFHAASASSKPAATLLTSIQSLCQKAQEATNTAQHHAAGYSRLPITQAELERLNGKTHLFSDTQGWESPIPKVSASTSSSSSSLDKGNSRSTSVTLSEIPEPAAESPEVSLLPPDTVHPIILEDLKDFAAHNPVPSVTSLSDSPSNSPMTIPISTTAETPPIHTSAPPLSQSRASDAASTPSLSSSAMPGSAFLDERSETPRRSQQHHERAHTPSSQPYSPQPGSTESTSAHRSTSQSGYQQHNQHPPSPSVNLLLPPHCSSAYSQVPISLSQHREQSSRATALRSSLQPPPPPLLGFATEFQHYYESLEVRRSSVMGVGAPGAPGGAAGFVSGFEPGGSVVLDGTWQGLIEQLGF